MKNYKFLVPLFLVFFFAASFYMLYDEKSEELKQYNEYIETARDYRKQGIRVDAEAYYQKALSQSQSLKLYIEIGEFYDESESANKAVSWGETMVDVFPKEPQSYEFLMERYAKQKDYAACFNLSEIFKKRKLNSELISKIISSIEYKYFFNEEYENVSVFGGGFAPVQIKDKWGFINQIGVKKVPCKFLKVGHFSGNLAPVMDVDGCVYFIDPEGNKKKVVLKDENIQELGFIENGIFSAFNGSTWDFYNDENELLFGSFDSVSSMGNGIAAVQKDEKWYIVDTHGKDLTGKNYLSVVMDEKRIVYRNDRLFVQTVDGFELIDPSGAVYGSQKYADAHIFNDTTYAAVKVNNKWGFVDASGVMKIEPQYENARSFSNGLAAVQLNGKWGFIDLEGHLVIEPEFDNSKDFNSNGCVFVYRNDMWALLRLYKHNY